MTTTTTQTTKTFVLPSDVDLGSLSVSEGDTFLTIAHGTLVNPAVEYEHEQVWDDVEAAVLEAYADATAELLESAGWTVIRSGPCGSSEYHRDEMDTWGDDDERDDQTGWPVDTAEAWDTLDTRAIAMAVLEQHPESLALVLQ